MTPPLAEDGTATGKATVQTSVKRGWFWGSSTTSNGKDKEKTKEKDKGDQVEVAKEAAEVLFVFVLIYFVMHCQSVQIIVRSCICMFAKNM